MLSASSSPTHLSLSSLLLKPKTGEIKGSNFLSFFSSQVLHNEKISLDSQKIIRKVHFDLFQKKLEKEYDPKVVQLLFEKLKKLNKTSLTLEDRTRFAVWCHYLDVEQRFLKNIHNKHAPQHRLLKHLLRYTQSEVYYRMRHTYQGAALSHKDVEQCEKNLHVFLDIQPRLVETYGEEVCHRALTKLELYPSELLLGLTSYPPYEDFSKQINDFFKEELALTRLIENSSFEELNAHAEEIKNRLHYLPNYKVAKSLFVQLALKTGRIKWLKASLPKSLIQQQAELFEASRQSHNWAATQKELIPLHESGGIQTQNVVYFLKGPLNISQDKPVAVFKEAKRAAAKEVLMYDISVIFGLQNAYAPTKLTHIQDKFGSLQTFQNGITWNDFYSLYLPQEEFVEVAPAPNPAPYLMENTPQPWQWAKKAHLAAAFFNRYYAYHRQQTVNIPLKPLELAQAYCQMRQRKIHPMILFPWQLGKTKELQKIVLNRLYSTFSGDLNTFKKMSRQALITTYLKPQIQKIPKKNFKERFKNFEDELFSRVSMEDYLKAGLGTLLLGNRDLHTGNFFFVPKKNGQYSIVMFDNEESLYPSNYVVVDHKGHCHLPARNALLIFPQADVILTGEMKKTLQGYINSFESRFNQFLDYLSSPKGKSLLEYFPRKEIEHYSLKAFKQRIETLIQLINSKDDFTYREIYYCVFPLYETFLKLVQFIEPFYPEMLVGYHPAEELCEIAVEKGAISEDQQKEVLQYIHSFENH